ncbi:hypothetical protein GGR50DRAFT_698857 [Xylaria sp. CBS 124048]|nr:hypothetical protein GGR50DRAFT_698857 [Xylaria sp. CBS 124048]
MTRGNQREKAREKNLKAQAAQKSKNTKTGTEMQRDKEALAILMRQKQEAADARKVAAAGGAVGGAAGGKKNIGADFALKDESSDLSQSSDPAGIVKPSHLRPSTYALVN